MAAPRVSVQHLLPRGCASARPQAQRETPADTVRRIQESSLRLAAIASEAAERSGDPAQIAQALRANEAALRMAGLLKAETPDGAPALVVTVGPDAEAAQMSDDELGSERPVQPASLA